MRSHHWLVGGLFCAASLLLACEPGGGGDAGPGDAGSADAQTDAGQGDAAVALPSTPAGQQLEAMIALFNSTCTWTRSDYDGLFSATYQADVPLVSFNTGYARILCASGLQVSGWEDTATDTMIWARIHDTVNDTWLRLAVQVEDSEPHLIDKFKAYTAPDLDPLFGALQATQFDVLTYDPSAGSYLSDILVEALDRATGQPLSPAVTARSDSTYHLARLTLPAGVDEVGLRLTHTDGQISYVYSANCHPGAEVLAPAYPATAFDYYADQLGVVLLAGKAQLWGIPQYVNTAARMFTFDETGGPVGCAAVSLSPAAGTVYYTSPPNYLPNTTATQTHPDFASWYSFNLDAAAYTISTQATGDALAMNLPPLVADAPTTVYTVFQAPAYSANPMASDCSQ